MLPLPDGRTVLRWMFMAVGVVLLFTRDFVIYTLLRVDHWAKLADEHRPGSFAGVMSGAYVYLLVAAVFCLATGVGLKRDRKWARWIGAAASALLLVGFPVLTALGAVGMYALFVEPPKPAPRPRPSAHPPTPRTKDFWEARRSSKVQPFISGAAMFFAIQAMALLCLYAQHAGMPAWNPGGMWWVYLLLFLLVQTAVHELGHTGMAWTLFFKVKAVAVGPLGLFHNGYRFQFRFDWRRVFDSSGYTGAVPVSEERLLFNEIAVTAAGPVASLTFGLLSLLVFFSLPGSGWEKWWWVPAYNAALGVACALMSLTPVGYSDGAMLYHLIQKTPAGQQLLDTARLGLLQEKAAAAHGRAEFDKEVELREEALRAVEQAAEPNSMSIALRRLALGNARLACEDWVGAEADFRKCLESEVECQWNSALKANAWAGLHKVCAERYWLSEAVAARASAVSVLEQRKRISSGLGFAVTTIILAQVHLKSGEFELALKESTDALPGLPVQDNHLLLLLTLHAIQAQSRLEMGATEEGLAEVRKAVTLLRSTSVPEELRGQVLAGMGNLGEALWMAGQSGQGIDLMREAIQELESRGVLFAAAQRRVCLAGALRQIGRCAEAVYTLPDESNLPPWWSRRLRAERVELHLAGGRRAEAIDEGRRLLAVWQAEPGPPRAEVAAAEALLARACLEAGDVAEAESLARRAIAVLELWGHPDAADCRITLALATRERQRAVFDNALRLIGEHPLLGSGEKARRIEFENARIERFGPVKGTAQWETPVPVAT